MQVSKDPHFVGYTYKNFEVVGAVVRKKSTARTPLSAVTFGGAPHQQQQAGAAAGAEGAAGADGQH